MEKLYKVTWLEALFFLQKLKKNYYKESKKTKRRKKEKATYSHQRSSWVPNPTNQSYLHAAYLAIAWPASER